ncbi:hypothetical protein O7635_23450 [Asanoa sp. WMMD1127]|uniref:Kae1-like domain-containing protein n=1 Tax=Asanoa sp. WMMD1127 TaxID=3016107 RepID=UPI002415AD1D|nr:hypothetical protein [Asanoa sp. WMMD1127]MDG4824816.1 hypothetical protein [Asanoa sp. WMMD1127]
MIGLPWEVTPTLAVGPDQSVLGAGRHAWVSEVADPDGAVRDLTARSGVTPEVVAVDLHPAAAHAVRGLGLPIRAVGRHHALVAAVLAAHGLGPDDQVIGFAFDGGGYGPDGATWGGEVLVAGYKGFRRFAHLDYVRCAGATAGRPHRAALAHLHHAGVPWDLDLAPVRACSTRERRVLARQLETGYGCATTSSAGLLLAAIRSLLGLPDDVIARTGPGGARPYAVRGLDPAQLVRAVVADLRDGRGEAEIVARVDATVVALVADEARRCAEETGLRTVVLAGDVFDDQVAAAVTAELTGLTVLAGPSSPALGRLLCAAAG